MEADEKQPEVQLAQGLAQHFSGHFREPIVERSKGGKKNAAHNHIVKVGNHVIRVPKMPVEGRYGQSDSGQPGDQKLKQETGAEHHGSGEADLASPHSREPVEYLDS